MLTTGLKKNRPEVGEAGFSERKKQVAVYRD
jgi:hypothetical protein